MVLAHGHPDEAQRSERAWLVPALVLATIALLVVLYVLGLRA
jgi:hypothetical protein